MVTETNLRRDVFRLLFNLINDNKPSGWYCRASISNVDAEFPLILLNPVQVEAERWSTEKRDVMITIKIDLFVHSESNNATLDVGRDNVYKTLNDNLNIVYGSDNLIIDEINDISEPSIEDVGDNTFITASIMVRMRI